MNHRPARARSLRNKLFALGGPLIALAIVACGGGSGGEQSFALPTPAYPTRTIDFIVGAEQGSPEDDFAQAMAAAFADEIGGVTNVVYQPGNAGVTALEAYANVTPDGHSLLVVTDAMLAAVAAGHTTVDATRAYFPSILGVFEPHLLFAGPDTADWDAALAAAQDGGLTVASSGPEDGLEHISIRQLAADLGIDIERVVVPDVPAKLAAPGNGTANLVIASLSEANAAIVAGDLVPVLALWPTRVPGYDAVPTALESGSSFRGLPGLRGVVLHRRIPQFIVDRIQQALRRAKNGVTYQAWLADHGLSAIDFPSGDPGLTLREQIPAYAELLAP